MWIALQPREYTWNQHESHSLELGKILGTIEDILTTIGLIQRSRLEKVMSIKTKCTLLLILEHNIV